MTKNFDEFYNNLKLRKEQEANELDKKVKKKTYTVIGIILAVGIIISILSSFLFMVVIGIICLIIYFIMMGTNKDRNIFYKSQIVTEIINDFKEYLLKYYPSQGMEKSIYDEASFNDYDTYNSEDLIVGRINEKYNLKIAEVRTSVTTTDAQGEDHTTVEFWGIFGVVELDKSINTKLQLVRNTTYLIANRNFQINLDSAEFEKYFDVGCNNRMLAMQIFTSDMMQEIVDIYESDVFKLKKRFPEIMIKNNKIYIRISTGNFLDTRVSKDLFDYETIKDEYNLLKSTLTLLEKFTNKLEEIL